MQIFHHSTNTIAKVSIFGGIFLVAASLWVLAEINRSSYNTGQFIEVQQPVQFSHKHHVGDDGIDCRYCHTSVETSNTAGMPPTKTCMNCHSQIWNESPYLEIVRTSFRENKPIEWARVHDLPDFVFFDHSIHVAKGVGCVECHGRVDRMPRIERVASLEMQWCLSCHRDPAPHLRRPQDVFDMASRPPRDPQVRASLAAHLLPRQRLTDCSTCHR